MTITAAATRVGARRGGANVPDVDQWLSSESTRFDTTLDWLDELLDRIDEEMEYAVGEK